MLDQADRSNVTITDRLQLLYGWMAGTRDDDRRDHRNGIGYKLTWVNRAKDDVCPHQD